MRSIICFLIGLSFTIALIVIVCTIDFSSGASNIYFNTVKEIVKGDAPIILKNLMYGLNCALGFIVNSIGFGPYREQIYSALDGVFWILQQAIQFFEWLFSTIGQKFAGA